MHRNQVLPQAALSDDPKALRRVDFSLAQVYKGAGFLPISAMPRVAEEAAAIDSGDGFEWQVQTYFNDSPAADSRHTLHLELRGRIHLICQRCLQDCECEINESRDFVMLGSEAQADAYPIEDAAVEPLVASPHFDLIALIEDEILLSLPLIPKHAEGICEPHLTSFNQAENALEELEEPQNPFNILKNMKKNQ